MKTTLVCRGVWSVNTVMRNKEGSCRNCAATTHCASWTLPSDTEVCTSKPGTEVRWAGMGQHNGHRSRSLLRSSSTWLVPNSAVCSRQEVDQSQESAERSTAHHLAVCNLRLRKQELIRTCRTKRSYCITWEALVDKHVRQSSVEYRCCSDRSRNAHST